MANPTRAVMMMIVVRTDIRPDVVYCLLGGKVILPASVPWFDLIHSVFGSNSYAQVHG
jgi:hypothetical protein